MDAFDSISPLDYRYANKEISRYLSENARVKYLLKVECAASRVMAKFGACPERAAEEICSACSSVNAEEVRAEEERINHDIRALVNCIRNRVSDEAKMFVHLGLTSYDVVNTADSLRYKEFAENILIPSLIHLEKTLIGTAKKETNTLQIGRTHGQHAEPVTFGFAMAEYVDRLGNSILEILRTKENLVGKISGAVGAYNALSLLTADPEKFEEAVLKELGLKKGNYSTQITEPEYMLNFIHSIISCFGILANLADDMRHLQRTEISEVSEAFGEEQVGSSTMPHKKNPVSFENVKSIWKAMMPRIITLYMDQISEHQRDLTNSASGRFTAEILASLYVAAERLSKAMKTLAVDRNRMNENFRKSRDMIIAEPLYVLLAYYGHKDAHEAVRRLSARGGILDSIKSDSELLKYWKKFTAQQKAVLENPEKYTGIAAEKAEKICRHWEEKMKGF